MTDYEKIKKLLEYFVSHLQYAVNAIDKREFIQRFSNLKELFDKNRFAHSGQGYNGHTIQTQISQWEEYSMGVICINIAATSFTGRGSYLNWEGTGYNVLASWNDNKKDIVGLQLAICSMEGKKGFWENVGKAKTLEDLGLFDDSPPNSAIKTFFDNYCKMYRPQLYNNMNIVNLLKSNKNLILTGAPGVGKTFKTTEIAVAITDGAGKVPTERKELMIRYKELIESKQIAFTTFHQSLDYEEFVEGLKPNCEDGNVVYNVENGIFKTVCERAIEKGSLDSFSEAIEELKIDCLDNEKTIKSTTVTGAPFSITYRGGTTFRVRADNSQAKEGADEPVNIEHIKQLYELPNEADVYKHPSYASKYIKNIYHPSYAIGIINYLKQNYKLKNYKNDNTDKKYILIIDEINRGNISKIFGELITLLEKDKRIGEDNEITVTLPYSQEKFGVPSNLYIIGTMNTADRSIGAIDYALRRRFAFVSLKADKNIISTYNKYQGSTKTKAENLFDAIKTFIESNINDDLDAEDLMVGHSYFLCETEDDLKRRLEYEIIPLLWEYQKDGIITCERKILKDTVSEWQNL